MSKNPEILLINAGFGRRHFDKVVARIPNLGILCIAGYLEQNGVQVLLLDADAKRMSHEEVRDFVGALPARPEYVGISATTVTINSSLQLCGILKEAFPQMLTVIGGPHASLMPAEVLQPAAVDFVVRGEGEQTLLELMGRQKKLEEIQGLSFKHEGALVHNPARALISNLDALPLPAYHLIPMDDYKPGVGNYQRLPFMPMTTSKGCTGQCTFCATHLFGRRLRFKSPERVLEELELLVRQYHIKEIIFYDDVFSVQKKRTLAICSMIVAKGLDLTWSCLCRADQVDREILSAMKAAGCHTINFGIESGDIEILKTLKKEIDYETVRETVALCKSIGIHQRLTFMFGNPGETVTTMEKTFALAKALDPTHALFNITTPYPGSEMFEWADQNNLLLTKDWSRYSVSEPILKIPTVSREDVERYCFMAREYFLKRYEERTPGNGA